jgi:hypothetical protein
VELEEEVNEEEEGGNDDEGDQEMRMMKEIEMITREIA